MQQPEPHVNAFTHDGELNADGSPMEAYDPNSRCNPIDGPHRVHDRRRDDDDDRDPEDDLIGNVRPCRGQLSFQHQARSMGGSSSRPLNSGQCGTTTSRAYCLSTITRVSCCSCAICWVLMSLPLAYPLQEATRGHEAMASSTRSKTRAVGLRQGQSVPSAYQFLRPEYSKRCYAAFLPQSVCYPFIAADPDYDRFKDASSSTFSAAAGGTSSLADAGSDSQESKPKAQIGELRYRFSKGMIVLSANTDVVARIHPRGGKSEFCTLPASLISESKKSRSQLRQAHSKATEKFMYQDEQSIRDGGQGLFDDSSIRAYSTNLKNCCKNADVANRPTSAQGHPLPWVDVAKYVIAVRHAFDQVYIASGLLDDSTAEHVQEASALLGDRTWIPSILDSGSNCVVLHSAFVKAHGIELDTNHTLNITGADGKTFTTDGFTKSPISFKVQAVHGNRVSGTLSIFGHSVDTGGKNLLDVVGVLCKQLKFMLILHYRPDTSAWAGAALDPQGNIFPVPLSSEGLPMLEEVGFEERSTTKSSPMSLQELGLLLRKWEEHENAASPSQSVNFTVGGPPVANSVTGLKLASQESETPTSQSLPSTPRSCLKTPPQSPAPSSSTITQGDDIRSSSPAIVANASALLDATLSRSASFSDTVCQATYESDDDRPAVTHGYSSRDSELSCAHIQLEAYEELAREQQELDDVLVQHGYANRDVEPKEANVNTRSKSKQDAEQAKARDKVRKIRRQTRRVIDIKYGLMTGHDLLHRNRTAVMDSVPGNMQVVDPRVNSGRPTRFGQLSPADTRLWDECTVCQRTKLVQPVRHQNYMSHMCAECQVNHFGTHGFAPPAPAMAPYYPPGIGLSRHPLSRA